MTKQEFILQEWHKIPVRARWAGTTKTLTEAEVLSVARHNGTMAYLKFLGEDIPDSNFIEVESDVYPPGSVWE